MSNPRSGCASWAPACSVFAIDGFHVTGVEHRGDVIVVDVQTDVVAVGCPGCGVLAEGRGRRVHRLADAPAFGLAVQTRWSKPVGGRHAISGYGMDLRTVRRSVVSRHFDRSSLRVTAQLA